MRLFEWFFHSVMGVAKTNKLSLAVSVFSRRCIADVAAATSAKKGAVNTLSDTFVTATCETTPGGHKLAIQVAILRGLKDSFNGQYNSDLMATTSKLRLCHTVIRSTKSGIKQWSIILCISRNFGSRSRLRILKSLKSFYKKNDIFQTFLWVSPTCFSFMEFFGGYWRHARSHFLMMILGEHRECAELSCVIIVSASVLEKTKGHALFFHRLCIKVINT